MDNFREILKIQLLALIFSPLPVWSQSAKEMKEIYKQAEANYLYEEYDLANQLYILLEDPENLNLKYKIGTCYLNIPDEKEKAIPYLEEAVKNASYSSKTKSLKEKRAPLDAWFYLAKAYMINNELEKGLTTLRNFKSLALETEGKGGMRNLDFVDQQIRACENAIKLAGNPVAISKRMLGGDFSQGSMNENPAVSFDGNTIAYTERRGLVNVIYFSKKIRGRWQPPVEITSQLAAGEDCSTSALNSDGTELFLYKNDNFDGNIYSSKYVNESWTPIEKLNKNINTKYYESHAAISADGRKLYFTSNREGGQGGLDIYVSEIDATGDWGIPVNLGSSVNTSYNEDNPFITRNDSLLYFCSEGHNSIGGFDNYRCLLQSSGWGTPENLGSPINTTDDDKFFQPVNNGMNAYYSMKTEYKKRDIFYLGIGGPDVNQIYEITGNLKLNDTVLTADKNYYIVVLNKESGETLYRTTPDKKSGVYSLTVAPGDFRIIYSGDGYLPATTDTTILSDSPDLVITLGDVTLVRDSSLLQREYERINLAGIPSVASVDSSMLIRNLNVLNITDAADEPGVLYYTVQVMALYNPVDVSYFRYIADIKVMYNEKDKFYRYTTGQFRTKDEAKAWRLELLKRGYPNEIFIKKVLQ
jgi:Tol biopolymer transport system component